MSLEKRAIIAATATAILLTVLKTVVGILSGSMAVLASATDSLLDFFVSLVNLFAVRKSEQKANQKYHYGFGKIEWLGAMFEWVVVSVSGGLIGFFAVKKLISWEWISELGVSLGVMVVSLLITALLVWFLNKTAKKTGSLIIASDALHYKTDLLTNGGVLVALVLIKISGLAWIDGAISLAISLYIIYSAFGIITEAYHMLMDRSISEEEETIVHKVIAREVVPEGRVTSYHAFRTRRSGKTRFIEFHLVFDTEITLLEAHKISDRVECRVKKQIPNAEIIIHLDPVDDLENDACALINE